MAGDWIPRCKGLNRKPEVLQVAKATGLSRRVVADMLMEFWEWADSETTDGKLNGLSIAQLVEAVPGTDEPFWLAVVQSRWLSVEADGLSVPNYDRWLGKNAKRRLQDTERKKTVRILSASQTDKSGTTEQKRREYSSSADAEREKADSDRTELLDSLAEVTGLDRQVSGTHLGRVAKALRKADTPYTPAEVRSLPGILGPRGFTLPLTPGTVEKYIGLTRLPPPRREAAEQDITRRIAEQKQKSERDKAEAVPREKRQKLSESLNASAKRQKPSE